MNNEFGELFKKLRLQAGIATLTELGELLVDKGYFYEDSILSHWQSSRRVPTKRKVLLALIQIFHEKNEITIQDANHLLQSSGQGYLTDVEIESFQIKNNIKRINNPPLSNLNNSSKVSLTSEHLNQLLNKVRKLIADRGLDDKDWSKAFSSLYFIVILARMLNLTKNSDYKNLLNQFLSSFFISVDNSIIPSKENDLILIENHPRLLQNMIEEDEGDNYFSRYKKNSAQNIDGRLLHDNFMSGLMAQISYSKEFHDSLSLKMINEFSIRRLIYGDGKKPTDDHGGWYPRRVPWVTARILITLKNSGYEHTKYKDELNILSLNAIDYLINSMYQGSYWRSGTGKWCTDLEATGLCLEALEQWGKIVGNESKILPIIKYVLSLENELLKRPSFDSEKNSTDTLASVTLLSNVSIILHNYFKQDLEINYYKYFDYFSDVLDRVTNTSEIPVGQFCTVPQIMFYITRFGLSLSTKY